MSWVDNEKGSVHGDRFVSMLAVFDEVSRDEGHAGEFFHRVVGCRVTPVGSQGFIGAPVADLCPRDLPDDHTGIEPRGLAEEPRLHQDNGVVPACVEVYHRVIAAVLFQGTVDGMGLRDVCLRSQRDFEEDIVMLAQELRDEGGRGSAVSSGSPS